MSKPNRKEWLVPAGLVFLSLVPVIGGSLRLVELAGGPNIMPEGARFAASPTPVLLHIVSVTLYCLLGAFQFVPQLRQRRPRWHRYSGRILIPAGLIAALSGLWMSQFYDLPASDGTLLYIFRLIFGLGMIASILLGLAAVRRRDIARHRAWMMRAYAIGLGAGTQGFVMLPWILTLGMPGTVARALLMGAGWVINLAVAEWLLRRAPRRPGAKSKPGFARYTARPASPRTIALPANITPEA